MAFGTCHSTQRRQPTLSNSPIGKIESHSYSIDLSQSVENEYLCTLIAKEFGLPVPHCFMMQVGQVKALAVERFDRRYAADRSWIMRLPKKISVRY